MINKYSSGEKMADRSKDRPGSSDRCMVAIKEDLAAWMSSILSLVITVETLLEDLETGVVLCRLANTIQRTGEEFLSNNPSIPRKVFPACGVTYKERTAFRGSFIARDNVANFIRWCRELGVSDVIMFETEDLVLHKNEKSVILALMDVARLSVKFGLEPPDLVRMENEIDQEIEQQPLDEIMEEPMIRLKKEHKSHSLDDLVYQVLDQCTCPVRFPVLRVAEGKYRMGESKNLIFVRVMRKHVMVRVGGGWDTLERYFDKHDPCKISEKQRRNSLKSPRSRSASDAIGRSPSSLSLSSSDSHESGGLPVSHGRTASWSSSQNYASQLKSPREPVRKMTSCSPTRSPSPGSPRLQQRQRRGMTSRDTPPRTIDTQHRGRLTRRSKSMQELSTVAVSDSRNPCSKLNISSGRKPSASEETTTASSGSQGQNRTKSLAISPRKESIGGPQADSSRAKGRLSSSGPVRSNRSCPSQVSRSASFGSRPRPMVPVMEPRSRTMITSGHTKEKQRRASSAAPLRSESKDDLRRKEAISRRRSSSATPQEKMRLHSSPNLPKKSTESKNDTTRRPSVSKIPTLQQKQRQEQPVSNRKPSTGSKEAQRVHRTLPSTPGEKKSSKTPQINGTTNKLKPAPMRSTMVDNKMTPRKTPFSFRQENKSGNQKKQLESSQSKDTNINVTEHQEEEQKQSEVGKEDLNKFDGVDASNATSFIQRDNLRITLDQISPLNSEISSPVEPYPEKLTLNGVRKLSGCSLETESDGTSDLLSDFTDTDYDFRSQRYSGLSETSSDISVRTSPASMPFNSVEILRDSLDTNPEPDSSAHSTLKDCLMNLNLQGTLTQNTKRRIFEVDSQSYRKEENSETTDKRFFPQPADKAMFFDVEQYNEKQADDDDVIDGSPRKLSLVQSLISSIEKRNSNSGDGQRSKKKSPFTSVTAGEENSDESGIRNHSSKQDPLLPLQDLHEKFQLDNEENDLPVAYDVNSNVSSSGITESQRIPAEKPLESLGDKVQGVKTRKSTQDKARKKEKELDVFPRPQRQFTLEEMIEDMMPTDTESKESITV